MDSPCSGIMKHLIPLSLAVLTCQAPADTLSYDDGSTPLGVEILTGYRSQYVERGFRLSDDLIEAQLETEIALSHDWVLNLGMWHGTANGNQDFSETNAYLDFRYEYQNLTLGVKNTWFTYEDSVLDDGVDFSPYLTYKFSDDFSATLETAYNSGAEGWYVNLEGTWSHPTSEKSFASFTAGTSAVNGYYDRDGANDLHARLGWTYQINRSIAVTPFAGLSLPYESKGIASDESAFGGLWLEVNF
jgi:hypothetical protein